MPINRPFLTASLAGLTLLAMTTGCGTSTTETASTITAPATSDGTPPVVVQAPLPVAPSDPPVSTISGRLEGQITDAEGRVAKVAGETQSDVKRTAYETKGQLDGVVSQLRDDSTQATGEVRQAVEQIKGGAKKVVSNAEKEARSRAKALKDGVEKSGKDLEKDVLDNFLPPR